MQELVIYHNPQCSKSRKALELLHEKGLKPIVVDYLKSPLNFKQLKALSSHFPFHEFIRTDDAVFQELYLSLDDKNTVLKSLINHPQLMQRPIVTYKGNAVIGRPPEKILALFNVYL